LGGALGGLIGRQADRAVFGSGSRQGARLKELAVTTSSYGQPISRHFGRMRVAGSIIWSTDLIESESIQGGKIQGSTTSYVYSASFAVALSSRPILSVERIWADGNLLRGRRGDLKVGGKMRIHPGYGDDDIDPIIAADKGSYTPAFRDCAYVVFENLQLADFGNRIPTLSFEIIAEEDAEVSLDRLVPQSSGTTDIILEHARGFSDEGGSLSAALSAINQLYPITCIIDAQGLKISSATESSGPVKDLPEQLSERDSEDAEQRAIRRSERLGQEPIALRYYDEQRDYQPGVQRAIGTRPGGREVMLDLPVAMSADGAKKLANARAHRSRWSSESMIWRIGVLDPSLQLGDTVRVPGMRGLWRLASWEWFDRGIELGLEKLPPARASGFSGASDAGVSNPPADVQSGPTIVHLFELPFDGIGNPVVPLIYVAASSAHQGWSGASLYAEHGSALIPIGTTGARRATLGVLASSLAPSQAVIFEGGGEFELQLAAGDIDLEDADITRIASGANRLLVGSEVLQFCRAEPLGGGRWSLKGLLRGRAGTEDAAALGHALGTTAVLLDDRIKLLDPAHLASDPSSRIAAIGRADDAAVYAGLSNFGLSRRPPSPVHPSCRITSDQTWELHWVRRARGQWLWSDGLDLPLVEEFEAYRVGLGPVDAPFATWNTTVARFELSPAVRSDLVHRHGTPDLWVQQIGNFGRSPPLFLAKLG
jgi:hypothetical protein